MKMLASDVLNAMEIYTVQDALKNVIVMKILVIIRLLDIGENKNILNEFNAPLRNVQSYCLPSLS